MAETARRSADLEERREAEAELAAVGAAAEPLARLLELAEARP